MLAAVAGSTKDHPRSCADVYRIMVERYDFTSVAGMTFDDVVRLAVKLGLVTHDEETDQLFLKR
jgi:hypothetical protein